MPHSGQDLPQSDIVGIPFDSFFKDGDRAADVALVHQFLRSSDIGVALLYLHQPGNVFIVAVEGTQLDALTHRCVEITAFHTCEKAGDKIQTFRRRRRRLSAAPWQKKQSRGGSAKNRRRFAADCGMSVKIRHTLNVSG